MKNFYVKIAVNAIENNIFYLYTMSDHHDLPIFKIAAVTGIGFLLVKMTRDIFNLVLDTTFPVIEICEECQKSLDDED